jgi:anti-sigma regulatory factor (Ser/Thr protein kinase)
MLTYRATYACGYGAVRRARLELTDFAARCGFDDGMLADIESAIGEALANAAEHGNHGASAGFDVIAAFEGARLDIEVKDCGPGFDSERLLAASTPDANGNRGFGIFLMQQLMDDVAYTERGSRVRLSKRLAAT